VDSYGSIFCISSSRSKSRLVGVGRSKDKQNKNIEVKLMENEEVKKKLILTKLDQNLLKKLKLNLKEIQKKS
jgi:hypothetical protein